MFGNELWYSSLPVGWSVKKFKYVASLYTGNSIKDSEKDNYTDKRNARPYIATKHIEADNNKIDYENGLYVKHDDTSFRVAKRGSTLMCIEGGSAGKKKSFLTQDVSFVNKLCCFEPNFRIDSKYLFYYLMSPNYEEDFRTRITGLIGGVSVSELLNMSIITPPLSEQQAIADYLDETCSKIDEIIAEAKASIDEYKELKQSVIFEAVTKGLNKNVEMKDSSVEGMGFIPAKWSVVRFMKVNYVRARLGWKGLKAEEYVDVGYPFLAAYHIVNGHLCWENLNCITKERYDESPEIKLSIGDLVLVKDGAGIGKCARIDDMPLGEATVNSSLSVITPNKLLDYRYEYYYFMSPLFQNIIARLKNGMGVPHLTQESMKDIYLPLPSKNEQQAIANYLDNKMIGLDSLISEKESLIKDLEAYKKSLIYEVVTGKRRVV